MTDRIYNGYTTRRIPRGGNVDCTDGRAVVARPDGGSLAGYTAILYLEASEYDTSLEGVRVDGRRAENPEWPIWNADPATEHTPNIDILTLMDETVLPDGTVYLDGVTSTNAVSDGLHVSMVCRVDVRRCTFEGARFGMGISAAGCTAVFADCTTNNLKYEPNAQALYPLPSLVTMERITLDGVRACNLLIEEPAVTLIGTDIGVAAELRLEDGAPPDAVTSVGARMTMTRCQGDTTVIYTPKALILDDCSTGPVFLYWQTASRQYDGGQVTVRNCALLDTWTTYGYGQIDIEDCTGNFVIIANDASGPFDPRPSTPLVLTRAGNVINIEAAGTYTVDELGALI